MYHSPSLHFENILLKWSNSVKYLGVTIDSKLSFTAHIKSALHKASGAKFTLFPLINKFSPLSLKTKLYLYNTYIKPILLYASPAWSQNLTKTSWTKLEAFQSKTLRLITGSDWFVSNHSIRMSLNIPTLNAAIKNERSKILHKMTHSNYEHISNIINRKCHKELFKRRPLTQK